MSTREIRDAMLRENKFLLVVIVWVEASPAIGISVKRQMHLEQASELPFLEAFIVRKCRLEPPHYVQLEGALNPLRKIFVPSLEVVMVLDCYNRGH